MTREDHGVVKGVLASSLATHSRPRSMSPLRTYVECCRRALLSTSSPDHHWRTGPPHKPPALLHSSVEPSTSHFHHSVTWRREAGRYRGTSCIFSQGRRLARPHAPEQATRSSTTTRRQRRVIYKCFYVYNFQLFFLSARLPYLMHFFVDIVYRDLQGAMPWWQANMHDVVMYFTCSHEYILS